MTQDAVRDEPPVQSAECPDGPAMHRAHASSMSYTNSIPESGEGQASRLWALRLLRILVIGIVLVMSVAIFLYRDAFSELALVGYPGIFLVSLLGNATLVLPAPSLALVFAMGSALPPVFVGLAAGLGSTLGELTGYAAGFGGRAVVENWATYERMQAWMQRRGAVTLLVLAIIPNPLFDLAGIAAGTLRYPLWRFLLICWLGKTIKTVLVAWAGALSLNAIEPLLR
jgi:membrane protein YqaA with SNARE-associated domain